MKLYKIKCQKCKRNTPHKILMMNRVNGIKYFCIKCGKITGYFKQSKKEYNNGGFEK